MHLYLVYLLQISCSKVINKSFEFANKFDTNRDSLPEIIKIYDYEKCRFDLRILFPESGAEPGK